jgi:hypothetical protein
MPSDTSYISDGIIQIELWLLFANNKMQPPALDMKKISSFVSFRNM